MGDVDPADDAAGSDDDGREDDDEVVVHIPSIHSNQPHHTLPWVEK